MKKKLELGAGNNRREIEGYKTIAVDLYDLPGIDHIVNLGFEKLPFDDDTFDLVQAFDVLEHIPKIIYVEQRSGYYGDGKREYHKKLPFIFLMNEVYRVMKDKSFFITEVPFSEEAFYRDPTHVSRLSNDWYHYFQIDDNLYYDQGLVTCNFKLINQHFRKYLWKENDIMHTELAAIKNKEDVLI